ncbi:uncharacterized protein LOC131668102 isoform X2 [Phymastichus coffea]|uniref:uncharacterized protein LOC131668102 isoform X2 n=1 Tax=Phymastichus coffea TaxID=108790 RepID=UPI00273C6016|nr:uncharacterized protein LOC131668102 isoform X2 [Phymastichus coffea]
MKDMDSVSKLVLTGIESAAQMSVGQAILRMVDKIMWVIEKSMQWSLPAPENVTEENGKSFGKPELVRPLPWIVFLPTILMLRVFRASINAVVVILGYPTVEPSDMIRVVQRGRRRLRTIKTSALKSIRQNQSSVAQDRPMSMKEASKSLAKSIRLTLSTLSCLDAGSKSSPSPPPTKIRVSNYLDMSTPMPEGNMQNENKLNSPKGDVKRKYSELSDDSSEDDFDDEETLIARIERLANESGSDESYNPNVSNSDVSISTDSDPDVSITISEVEELNINGSDDESTQRENPAKEKAQEDSEKKKSSNEAETDKNLQVMERPQQLAISGWGNGSGETYVSGNGVGGDTDATYYSPISWKSISPDYSPDNKDDQIDIEKKPEELSNGEVNKKEKKNHDRNEAGIQSDETVVNGLTKEKKTSTSSQSGGSQKHHKHKRGNHGHRKKK